MMSGTYGTKASTIRTMTAVMTRMAPTVTTAAVFVRDQPRLRRAVASGANVAAMMIAISTDAVMVDSTRASQMTSAASATVTRTRQPSAARWSSQAGASDGRSEAGWPGMDNGGSSGGRMRIVVARTELHHGISHPAFDVLPEPDATRELRRDSTVRSADRQERRSSSVGRSEANSIRNRTTKLTIKVIPNAIIAR